ncbi:STAS domain-containing protein [Catenuloplanes sp. NPDC051500]|uniref:STAS domain-containing protein n=1 Tax=Catenuloplanes sp. NPDC051500 TaxID=3363959 RepID=UPI0037B04949
MIDDSPLRIDTHHPDPGTVALTVTGDLDFETADELVDHAAPLITTGVRTIRLDVSGLDLCDSSGLSALIHVNQDAQRVGATFVITGVTMQLMRILEVTGLDTVLGVDPAPARREAPLATHGRIDAV